MKIDKYLLSAYLLFSILIISYLIPMLAGNNIIGNYMFYLSIPVFFATLIYNYKSLWRISSILIFVFLCTYASATYRNNSFALSYFIIDYVGFFIVLSLPDILSSDKISLLTPYFLVISIFSIILYLFLIPNMSFWDDGRYAGFIHNVNMSVYIISFSLIYIWLYFSNKNHSLRTNNFFLLIIIATLFLFMYLSDSRSYGITILFFVSAFIRNLVKNASWLGWLFIIIIFLFVYIFILEDTVIDSRILSNDASMQTRLNLQILLYQEVLNSYMIPNGPNYTTIFIKSYTGNDQMHAHNDLISLYLNYGIFFLIGIYYFFKKLQINVSLANTEMIFLLILFFSTAFHGYLFSFILLIPFIMSTALIKDLQQIDIQPKSRVKRQNLIVKINKLLSYNRTV